MSQEPGTNGTSVQASLKALNEGAVRYLVAGGLAVVAHGHVRFTGDVDLLLDLEPENVRRALSIPGTLGYRPRAPVPMEQFADPVKRKEWERTKGLMAFSLYSAAHPATEVDLFVRSPIDFARSYERAVRLEAGPGMVATFVDHEDLVRLRRLAGRPQDLDDIARLERIRGEATP